MEHTQGLSPRLHLQHQLAAHITRLGKLHCFGRIFQGKSLDLRRLRALSTLKFKPVRSPYEFRYNFISAVDEHRGLA